jgi:hypothetical protein
MTHPNSSFADFARTVSYLNCCYWPAAGDTVLGVASVLLVLGAAEPDGEALLFGRPEFGDPIAIPLSEFV